MKTLATACIPLLALGCTLAVARPGEADRSPRPYLVAPRPADRYEPLPPSAVVLNGFLGDRVRNNALHRLAKVDLEPLLAGFRKKPGVHPWIGEHIGKWMHAATLAWAYTGNPALREKLDYAAAELVNAQEPDGYLGTYVPEKRFGLYEGSDWDVWSHKYNLVGLLTYYEYTGDEAALAACRKIGDLLIRTFGPGKKSILSAGTHMGMAATSVLEPTVLLYRQTGDDRYLEFARYLVRSWDEPNGPRIVATLLAEKQVNKTANAKAYEMLSNLVGLCELARATGDRTWLTPVLNAWEDIVARRLYLTGSASQGEHFHGDYELPGTVGAHVAETCVTTTWIQLNLQLLRLTGEARFGEQLERTFYNHLAAAQRPDGAEWCYFTSLEGTKPYGPGINCCVSSGPRGMALAAAAAAFRYRSESCEGLAINLPELETASAQLDGQWVTLEGRSSGWGHTAFGVVADKPTRFALRFRVPSWAGPVQVSLNGKPLRLQPDAGWIEVPVRRWKRGDQVSLHYAVEPRLILGDHGDAGKACLAWGPFVLAYDRRLNPGLPASTALGYVDLAAKRAVVESSSPLVVRTEARAGRSGVPVPIRLVPFADAGRDGGPYRLWLRAPGVESSPNPSLLADGEESRSRDGNQGGSILDGDPRTFVVTFNGQPAPLDWYAVALPAPATVGRVVFAHGQNFHDGGWFDAQGGKPKLELQVTPDGPWQAVGEFADYPATTATDPAGLTPGRRFQCQVAPPRVAIAVRIVGKPASGDNPAQAFSSCGELEAFAE